MARLFKARVAAMAVAGMAAAMSLALPATSDAQQKAAPAAGGKGKTVFDANCGVCHIPGAAGRRCSPGGVPDWDSTSRTARFLPR